MFHKESTHHTGICCMSCNAIHASRCTACIYGSAKCDRRFRDCGDRMTRTCQRLRTGPIGHVPIRLYAPPLRHSASAMSTTAAIMFRSHQHQCGQDCSIAGGAPSHEEQSLVHTNASTTSCTPSLYPHDSWLRAAAAKDEMLTVSNSLLGW